MINWENYRDWLRSDSIVATFLKDGSAEFIYICLGIFIVILCGVIPYLYWQKESKKDRTSKVKFIKYVAVQSISVITFLFMSFIPTGVSGYVADRDIHGHLIMEWKIEYLYQEAGDFLSTDYEGWLLLLIISFAITTYLLVYFKSKDNYLIQACFKQHPDVVFTELKLCALSYRRICNDGVAEKINDEYKQFWEQWRWDCNKLAAYFIINHNGRFVRSKDGKLYLPGVENPPIDDYLKEKIIFPDRLIKKIQCSKESVPWKYTDIKNEDVSEMLPQAYSMALNEVFVDYWKEKSANSTYGCVSVYAYALGEARRMIIGQGLLPTNGSMDIKMALQPFVLSGQTGTMFSYYGNIQPDKYEDMLKWMDAAVAGAYWARTGENTTPQGKFYFFQKLSKNDFNIHSIDAPNSEINKHPCLFNLTDSATNEILSDAVLRYKKFSRSGDVDKLYDGCQGRGL